MVATCPRCKIVSPNERICNSCGYVIDAEWRHTFSQAEKLLARAVYSDEGKRERVRSHKAGKGHNRGHQ